MNKTEQMVALGVVMTGSIIGAYNWYKKGQEEKNEKIMEEPEPLSIK